MDKNNIILLSHIGVEVMVVGGMFAYFQVKMNKQQEKIENLEKYISQLSSAVEMHEEAIKQIYSQINPQRGPPQRKKPRVAPPKTGGLKFNNEDVKNRKLPPKTAPVEEVSEEEIEEEPEDEFFDETELDEELEELEESQPEEEVTKKKGKK